MASWTRSQTSTETDWEHLEYFKDETSLMLFIQNLPKSHSIQTSDKLVCDLCINSIEGFQIGFFFVDHQALLRKIIRVKQD